MHPWNVSLKLRSTFDLKISLATFKSLIATWDDCVLNESNVHFYGMII